MKTKWLPKDNFYPGYSLAIHFGHGPTTEYRRIGKLLEQQGIPASEINIKASMDFVRDISIITKKIGKSEIKAVEKESARERIAGGVSPSDVYLAVQFLITLIPIIRKGGRKLADVFRKPKDETSKSMDSDFKEQAMKLGNKLIKDTGAKKAIVTYVQTVSVSTDNADTVEQMYPSKKKKTKRRHKSK